MIGDDNNDAAGDGRAGGSEKRYGGACDVGTKARDGKNTYK